MAFNPVELNVRKLDIASRHHWSKAFLSLEIKHSPKAVFFNCYLSMIRKTIGYPGIELEQ
jgi:hypothetical protein